MTYSIPKYLVFWILFCWDISICDASIDIVNELSFGTIVVTNNNSVSNISITPKNKVTITNNIRILSQGSRAEYFLSQYPAHTQIFTSVSISNTETSSPAPSSQQFTLTSLSTEPSVFTDAEGTATIYVGGSIETSGSGGKYFDTAYRISFQLTVNY